MSAAPLAAATDASLIRGFERDFEANALSSVLLNKTVAEVVNNDQMRIRDLPPQLQDLMLNLQVGQATPPFGSLSDGVRALILCGRDDPQPTSGPSFEQIQSQIEQDRVNRRAQRYLRDLRRDAVIEYR